jgi:ferredoxin-nitrite reductase
MEKLNRIERLKSQHPPAEFLERLDEVDWEHPDESNRFYLKNFGIYNIKLRPELWMIRFRFDGGDPDPESLRRLARTARREGARILLTARSQIELHGLGPARILPVWRELRAAGLESFQTLTDNFRALVTDPLADCAPDAVIDTFPLLEAIRERFLERPEWIGTLPRKFNTALIGRYTPSFNPWSNDLLFALAKKDETWGFNLYLGGRYSETARSADIFCPPESVADLFEAVAAVYKTYGPRGSRAKTRLYHLIETIGMERMRERIEEACGTPLPGAGTPEMRSSTENRDRLLPIRRYGRYGEIDPDTLERVADEAQADTLTLRLTPHQELWLFESEELRAKSEELNNRHSQLSTLNSQFASSGSATACAGSRYCPLSLWDVKEDLGLLPVERLEKLGVSLGFSGCLKGCGRHYHADLGIIGLRTNLYGETERAVRIFLGALQAPDPAPGRMLYYSVPLRRLNDLIHTILDDFEASGRKNFEAFSREVLNRYTVEFLQLWYLLRQLYDLDEKWINLFLSVNEKELLQQMEQLENFPSHEEIYEITRELSHRLWDASSVQRIT